MHLYFEESDKPKPPSKFSHKLKTIPQRELLAKIHKEIREGEEDNVGVEAAHKTCLLYTSYRSKGQYCCGVREIITA